MTTPVVSMSNINFHYGSRKVLDNINFEIPNGAFMGLVGPNGGGKTTLIRLILGLEKPETGEIMVFGQPIQKLRNKDRIGFVSQKANSFNKGFPATVYEVVASGLTAQLGYFRFISKKKISKKNS